MRSRSCRRQHRLLPALILLFLSVPARGSPETGALLEFIYIDANVGSSSGGHAALKIEDSVYHFQNEDGYIRLAREAWPRFRFTYNELDNRNLHIAKVRVDDSAAERVRDRLGLLFMVQNRHMDFLEALDRDMALVGSLARGEPFEMAGPGFFERRPYESAPLHHLKSELSRLLGADFIAIEQGRLSAKLAKLAYPSQILPNPSPGEDRYPLYSPSFAEQAEDLYAHWLALEVLREEWPLRDGILGDVGIGGTSNTGLSDADRRWLGTYLDQLTDTVAVNLRAGHPGSGFPLLLALARFQAVSASLSAGHFLVLDALPPSHRAERFTKIEEQRTALNLLLNRLQAELPRVRRSILASEEPGELAYSRLESRASEIREIRRGLADSQPIRFIRKSTPPEGWGMVQLPLPAGHKALANAAKAAAERAEDFRNSIEALYRYDLLNRNCVTELVRAVNSAFPSRLAAAAALGGHVEPAERLSLIPHLFFDLLSERYRVESVELLPSYRNRMLQQLTARGEAWPIRAAESTTWTSSLYEPQPGDTPFLMFTEDMLWPRPLYGAINLAYGLGNAAVGLLAAPLDRGRRLKEGLQGAVFSLPELVFGNIRKGSFDGIRSRAGQDAEADD